MQCQDCHTIQDRHQNPCSISWLRKCGSRFQKSLYEKSKASRCDMVMVDSSFHKVELTGCKFSIKQIYLYKSLLEIKTWGYLPTSASSEHQVGKSWIWSVFGHFHSCQDNRCQAGQIIDLHIWLPKSTQLWFSEAQLLWESVIYLGIQPYSAGAELCNTPAIIKTLLHVVFLLLDV